MPCLFVGELGLRASDSALRSCVGDAFAGALDKEFSLPLGEGDHHVYDHFVCGARGIKGWIEHLDVDVALGEVCDGGHRLVEIAPEAVKPGYNEGVSGAHVLQRLS